MANDRHITRLDEDNRVEFRQMALDREIRSIKSKINEIIDVINQMNEPIYADDFDDDELQEMIKGEDPDAIFSPEEAKRLLADRRKAEVGKTIFE